MLDFYARHMPDDKNRNETDSNPILSLAMRLFERIAPGRLSDPEGALRDLVPRLRFLVVAQVEKPTVAQPRPTRFYRLRMPYEPGEPTAKRHGRTAVDWRARS